MGIRNYLVEGVSGTGKTSVAEELQRRGYHVLHGDRELKYRGIPETGEPIEEPENLNKVEQAAWDHQHLLWDMGKVEATLSDKSLPVSFFCGGCRNSYMFIERLDGVFLLHVEDVNELFSRMDGRVKRDPTEWGGEPEHKALVSELHRTKSGLPECAIQIDATQPLGAVVEEILKHL